MPKKNLWKSIIFLTLPFLLCVSLKSAADAAEKFPATLNGSEPLAGVADGQINTPEYVIIRPSDQATFSSETAAEISTVPFKEGASFHKGDILLEFDCRYQKAELKKALAQQTESAMASRSAEKLVQYGSISKFEVVKAQSEEQMANADVDKLRATVDKCTIRAPYTGAVANVIVHPDESVKPGDPLLKIVNTEYLEFEIQIPSVWLSWLHVGSMFNVRLNEIKKTITAKVTMIDPEIEPVSQSVKIIAVITPSDPKLLPGMSGQAIFTDNPENKTLLKKN
jgi:membrane fusion protein (multidrug efflux system)